MDIDPPIKKRGRPKKKRRGRPPNSVRFLNAEIMKDVQATTSELINKVKKTTELFNELDTTSESNSSGESSQIDSAKNVGISKSIEEKNTSKALEMKVTGGKEPETVKRGRPPKDPEEKNMKILEKKKPVQREPGGPKKPRTPKDTEKNNSKPSEMEKAGNKEPGGMKKVKKTTALEEIKKIKALEMKIIEQGSKEPGASNEAVKTLAATIAEAKLLGTEKIKSPSKKTELLAKKTELPAKKTEFPVKKAEFPVKKAESPVKKAESPTKREFPVKKTEFPVKKTEFPVKKTECPAKKTEFSVHKIELPLKKTEFSVHKTAFPVHKIELPLKKTEFSVHKTEFPVKKTEFSVHKIEFPVKKSEFSVDKTEFPVKKTDFSVHKIELPVKKSELSVNKTELPVKKTDFSVHKIELPLKKTEFSVHKIEFPVNKTEISEHKTEFPVKKGDFPVKKTELSIQNTELPVKETELSVQTAEFPVPTTSFSDINVADCKELGTLKKMQVIYLKTTAEDPPGPENEAQASDLNSARNEQPGTAQKILLNFDDKQPGTIKKILFSDLNAVRRKQLVTTKKTDIKVRSSVFTFIAKCNRQRLPAKILTKKPVIAEKIKAGIHAIRMKLGQQNSPRTSPEESSTMVKKNDSVINATEFIIMQKQKTQTQHLPGPSNCQTTVHAETSPDLVPVDAIASIPEIKSPENNMPVLDAENNDMPTSEAYHSETDEGDMTKEFSPLAPVQLDTIESEQIGEEKKIKMQSPQKDVVDQNTESRSSENMPILKDNSLVYTEIPPRMEEKLPECYVLLHRLTEEEIYMKYPYDSPYEVSDDVKRKTEELLSKTVEAMDAEHSHSNPYKRDGSRRCMRRPPNRTAAFQKYKENREAYLNRRNRSSHSENSLDWSPDESRTFSDGCKPKKKVKRSHKYERDYEWNPSTPKANSFTINRYERDYDWNPYTPSSSTSRTLRRHSRVPLIESESSSSDEDEILYNMYMEQDNSDDYDNSAFHNAVPFKDSASMSVNENSTSTSSSATVHQNSNVMSGLNSPLQKNNSGDILSGIIKNMNELRKENKPKTSFSGTLKRVNTSQPNNFKTKPVQRSLKRPAKDSELSELSTEKVVNLLLKEMISKVAIKFRYFDNKAKKTVRCKLCHTQFQPNRSTDIICAICRDLGREKELETKSVAAKKSVYPGKMKPLKENKGKKVNNTMSRVLKNLPKNEMQRLMYAEKTDKLTVGKGYNHCKSFAIPKQTKNVNASDKNVDNQNMHSNKISLNVNEASIKLAQIKRKESNFVNINQNKSNKISGQMKSRTSIGPEESENSQNKHCVSLEKYNDGLFLMTFPDPDKELDLEDKSPHVQIKQNGTAENISKLNTEQTGNKSQVSNTKQLQSVATKKYDTYLFPPIPTVIVSNYSSNTNSLNLSHTFFQNEITHQHALKSSKIQPNVSAPKVSAVVTVPNTMSCKNSSIAPSMLSNKSVTITAIPISNSISQIQPFTMNTVPVINSQPSVPASNVTLLPILSSVVSLSDKNSNDPNKLKEIVPSHFSPNNFVNSQQLDIKIDNVTSLKTYQKQDSSPGSTLNIDINSPGSAQNKRADSVIVKSIKTGDLSAKRKRSNSDRLSSENSETSDMEDLAKITNFNDKNESAGNKQSLNALVEDRSFGSNAGDHFEHSSKQFDKSIDDKENVAPQSAIASAIDMLGAISILAVIDLEKNPQNGLNIRIQHTKNQLGKLTSEKISTPEHNEKIASCQYNLTLLNIAKKYLSLYGSFIKVSDHLLRKAHMIQIKKEIHEEETNQSSCMFSQSSQLNNSLSNSRSDLSKTPDLTSVNQMGNFNSSSLSNQASMSHIEKLKSQIAAMNNVNIEMAQYGILPGGGTVHHYPPDQIAALTPTVAAPTPVTPRNDCLIGESRETPSRGSGPRTPARPESAASQSEEQTLIQIKKEQFEAANSPPSQCAYSQNTTLPQISSQLPVMSGVPDLNMPQQSVVNSTHLPVSSTNQVYPNQTNFSVQSAGIVPNRTAPYTNNQSYSDMFLNVGSKPQLRVTQATENAMRQNQQVILGQQMFIQNGSGMCSKQVVPSVNNNQYVIRPPYTTSNTGGTLIVNNSQVGQNALLTNVSNQQFYTSNQVSQLYYPPSSQITCMPSNNISNMVTQEVASAGIQQAEIESPDQMLCAVCNSQATLRCKQCARVAYCNTTCAKTYWHQKHKMECKPLGS